MSESAIKIKRRDGKPLGTPIDDMTITTALLDAAKDVEEHSSGIVIDEIALERVGQGFTQMCIVVNVRIGDKWFELIRDRETSSNSHRVTAEQMRKIMVAK